ncbi:hypothetical protein D3C81_1932010 [compost metagenome]
MARRSPNRLKGKHKVGPECGHRLIHQKAPPEKSQKNTVPEQLFNTLGEGLTHHMILFCLLGQCHGNNHRENVKKEKRHPYRGY